MATEWDDESLYSDRNDFPQSRNARIDALKQNKFKRADTGAWETAQTGVEYISPSQSGGIYGTVYRQYFTTSLPGDLTSGNNVSKIIDYTVSFHDGGSRNMVRGTGSTGAAGVNISLGGTSGNNNLTLSAASWIVIDGWVDYTK